MSTFRFTSLCIHVHEMLNTNYANSFFIYSVRDHDAAMYRAEKEGGKQLIEFLSHVIVN